ncbi:MAG: FecR domain-containing protein [Pseudomonadota bacterium]
MFKLFPRAGVACSIGILSVATALGAPSTAEAQARHEVRQIASSCVNPCTVQAGENETIEVILPDATSVILSPGSAAVISRDANRRIVVEVLRGLVRVAGGASNATTPILISTAHADMVVRNAAAIIAVSGSGTRTHLLNGDELLVTSAGTTRRIYRPGYQVIATSSRITQARRMDTEAILADILSLSPGLATGERPLTTSSATGTAAPSGSSGGELDDATGSVEETVLADIETVESTETNLNEIAAGGTPEPMAVEVQFGGAETGGIDLASGFGTSEGSAAATTGEAYTTTQFGNSFTALQDYSTIEDGSGANALAPPVSAGPTTNRILPGGDASTYSGAPLRFYSLDDDPNDPVPIQVWFDSLPSNYDTFGYTDQNVWEDGVAHLSAGPGAGIGGSFMFGRDWLEQEDVTAVATTFNALSFRIIFSSTIDARTGLAEDTLSDDPFVDGGAVASGIASGAGFREREADNFFLTEVTPTTAYTFSADKTLSEAQTLIEDDYPGADYILGLDEFDNDRVWAALLEPENPSRRFIFASGDLDALTGSGDLSVDPGAVDRFHIAGSMQGALGDISVGVSGVPVGMDPQTGRAFLPSESWTALAGSPALASLSDTGVILRYPNGPVLSDADGDGTGDSVNDAVLLHVDFGLSGAGDDQVSTISATIGSLEYRMIDDEVDGLIKALTVGTSQDAGAATLTYDSALASSSVGGGNHRLDSAPGRAGFFVLENAGAFFDDVGTPPATLSGGTETSLNGSELSFGLLRIGSGVSTDSPTTSGGDLGSNVGYAAGFWEQNAGGSVQVERILAPYDGLDLDEFRDNLEFRGIDPVKNNFTAELTLDSGAVLTFGGEGNSAFINDHEFGATYESGTYSMA